MKQELLNALLDAKRARKAVATVTQIASGAQRMVSKEESPSDPLGKILDEEFRFD